MYQMDDIELVKKEEVKSDDKRSCRQDAKIPAPLGENPTDHCRALAWRCSP